MVCKGCGASYSTEFNYCPHCGHATPESRPLNLKSQHIQSETEQTCPVCTKDDRSTSVRSLVMSQSSMVGYGDNEELRQTELAKSLMFARELKPRGIINGLIGLFDNSAEQLYEKVASRWDSSYYCSRCNAVFFEINGVKRHGDLTEFRRLLRDW